MYHDIHLAGHKRGGREGVCTDEGEMKKKKRKKKKERERERRNMFNDCWPFVCV